MKKAEGFEFKAFGYTFEVVSVYKRFDTMAIWKDCRFIWRWNR